MPKHKVFSFEGNADYHSMHLLGDSAYNGDTFVGRLINEGVFNSEDLAQSMFVQQYDGRLSLNDVLRLREVARTA
ncbi:hypothetical protein EMCRGX_G032916 [Ephydatia muelleri]